MIEVNDLSGRYDDHVGRLEFGKSLVVIRSFEHMLTNKKTKTKNKRKAKYK